MKVIHRFQRYRPMMGPRKRFRGKRQYFQQVQKKAERFRLEVTPEAWWDLWHYHADWPGYGNLRWSYRLEHLKSLATVFRTIVSQMDTYPGDFQTWIQLDAEDAGQDAVYLHTLNPNRQDFPVDSSHVQWGQPDFENVFRSVLPDFHEIKVGVGNYQGNLTVVAYCPGVGLPLVIEKGQTGGPQESR